MNHIFLIGMMGCGKTTCGRLLSERLGRPLLDTDREIEERERLRIPKIFEKYGEPFFRDAETALLRELAGQDGLIVATGGGMPLRPENRELMRSSGTVVFLDRDPHDIIRKVSMKGRPLGQGGEEKFLATYRTREPIYREAADLRIKSGETAQITLDRVLEGLRARGDIA